MGLFITMHFAHWLNAWKTSGQPRINGFKNYLVENVIKQLIHASAVRSSRYEARGKFGEHERCVRVARGVAESNSSFPRASYLDEARWRMNQLLIDYPSMSYGEQPLAKELRTLVRYCWVPSNSWNQVFWFVFFQIWFKNRRVKWRRELSKTKAEPTTGTVASCSVPNGLRYHYFNHVPYPSSKLMMKDARMLFQRSTMYGLDEDQ